MVRYTQLTWAISVATGVSEHQLTTNSVFRKEMQARDNSEARLEELIDFVKENTYHGGLFVHDTKTAAKV